MKYKELMTDIKKFLDKKNYKDCEINIKKESAYHVNVSDAIRMYLDKTLNNEVYKQLKYCLKDMESKDLGLIENRIEEVKHFLKGNK